MGEFFNILFLILLNGIFSMVELSVISSRRTRLEPLADAGDERAKDTLQLLDSPNEFLSTIQVGMTLIGILAGVYSGVTLTARLASALDVIPFLSRWSEPIAFFIIVTGVTYLTLVLGELLPKKLALAFPERLAMTFAPIFVRLSRFGSPIVKLLDASTEAIVRLFKLTPAREEEVTEEEIKFVLSQGTLSGAIEKAEEEMVHEVLRLGDRPVSALMTPRNELVWLSVDDRTEDNWRTATSTPFQYFPVGAKDIDDLIGIVSLRDLAIFMMNAERGPFASIVRQPVKVPSAMSALKLIERLKTEEEKVALAVDEYGGIDGLVTIDDLAQAIIGETAPEEGAEPRFFRREDGSFLVDAAMDVDDVLNELGLPKEDHSDHKGYHSFGGFILSKLGHIPKEGESVALAGYRLEIVDMDKMRIDKILVIPPK